MNCYPAKKRKSFHLFYAFAVVPHLVINRKGVPMKWCLRRGHFVLLSNSGAFVNVILSKYAHRKTRNKQSQNKRLKFAKVA